MPPISQLTVLVLPLITNKAALAGVTMYWPNCPGNYIKLLIRNRVVLSWNLPEAVIGLLGLSHLTKSGGIAFPTPVIISTLPKKRTRFELPICGKGELISFTI